MKKDLAKETINQLEKILGKETAIILNQKTNYDGEVISSGSLIINQITGIGGYPRGRVIEIFGPESSGKTTLGLHAIKEAQKANFLCAFIDVEHALDLKYVKKIGINLDNLVFAQPNSGEQALEIVDILIKSNNLGLIIVDSVAALIPESELNGEMKEITIGAQARLMSKALRKIIGSLNKTKTTVIFINQIREKIHQFFANLETTAGGRALRFYASIRIEVRKTNSITQNQEIVGQTIKIKTVKNKLATPFKTGTTELFFNHGICLYNELIDLATEQKVLEKNGSWYKLDGENIAQGKNNCKILLENNHELFTKISQRIKLIE